MSDFDSNTVMNMAYFIHKQCWQFSMSQIKYGIHYTRYVKCGLNMGPFFYRVPRFDLSKITP